MGRKAKPTLMKLVENSRDRRSASRKAGEPVPPGRLMTPPEDLSEDEQAEWTYVLKHAPRGLLKPLDMELLRCWVEGVCIRRDALRKLKASPLLIRGSKGNAVSSPYLRIVTQQTLILRALAADLGFSPVARTGIAIEEPQEEDSTDRFFK
jgi:P27 family predicted phage terminase small subunit